MNRFNGEVLLEPGAYAIFISTQDEIQLTSIEFGIVINGEDDLIIPEVIGVTPLGFRQSFTSTLLRLTIPALMKGASFSMLATTTLTLMSTHLSSAFCLMLRLVKSVMKMEESSSTILMATELLNALRCWDAPTQKQLRPTCY